MYNYIYIIIYASVLRPGSFAEIGPYCQNGAL
jgi:hypothetical protein